MNCGQHGLLVFLMPVYTVDSEDSISVVNDRLSNLVLFSEILYI